MGLKPLDMTQGHAIPGGNKAGGQLRLFDTLNPKP